MFQIKLDHFHAHSKNGWNDYFSVRIVALFDIELKYRIEQLYWRQAEPEGEEALVRCCSLELWF